GRDTNKEQKFHSEIEQVPDEPRRLLFNFAMEFLFFVGIPTFAYNFFQVILPLSGVRPGLAVALAAFTLGAVPVVMGLSARIKLPMLYVLYFLFGLLLKLSGALVIIGYLYSL
ncbi:MAG: hypothetical protein KAW91_02045, partial [candidate division Zixibacteria bacterium]|nr:hypothetical protein [candidate division Zixibacteria bacterium]